MEQTIITAKETYAELDRWLRENGCKKLLMVCDDSIRFMEGFSRHLEEIGKQGVQVITFRDFQPNPLYESVVKGVTLFRHVQCDSIRAVGGGSAMDVAKCILLSDYPERYSLHRDAYHCGNGVGSHTVRRRVLQ